MNLLSNLRLKLIFTKYFIILALLLTLQLTHNSFANPLVDWSPTDPSYLQFAARENPRKSRAKMQPLRLLDNLLVKLSLKKALPASRTNSATDVRRASEKSKLPSNQGKLCVASDKAENQPAANQLTINSADNSETVNSASNYSASNYSTFGSTMNIISNANSSHSAECNRLGDKENLSVWYKDASGKKQCGKMKSQMKNHRAIATRSKCPSASDLCKHSFKFILLTFIQLVTPMASLQSVCSAFIRQS